MLTADGPAPAVSREELFFPAGGRCFGCSRDNPVGLRLRFFRDHEGVRCETTVAASYQGAPGVVHGGIQAVLLDETCCAAAFFGRGTYVVTGALSLHYRRPCPVEVPLVIVARIVAREERFFRIEGKIFAEGGLDALTLAEGRFYSSSAREGCDLP